MPRPVEMRIELDAVVRYLVELGQRKNLKPAAIREYGLVPIHKLVQTARAPHGLLAGAHVQVIRIAENNLRPELFELVRRKRLYGRLRPDGHEHGRFNHAVRRGKLADARARLFANVYFLK